MRYWLFKWCFRLLRWTARKDPRFEFFIENGRFSMRYVEDREEACAAVPPQSIADVVLPDSSDEL